MTIPPSFSLIRRGKTSLLLKEQYKDLLLQQGIEEIETFLKRQSQASRYLKGRTPHPSVPLEEETRMVIRRYSHGGLLRAFTRDLYLFGSRAFEELALTEEIRASGIPTIEPIGAVHQVLFSPVYKAYFLSLEVPQAKDLIQYFQEAIPPPFRENLLRKREVIRSAGLLLRKFHRAGFFHGDLQLKNILVADGRTLLIDFDRSYRKKVLPIKDRVKNLLRLNRSVEKWKRLGLPITRADRWRFFLAYAGDDARIREVLQKALRTTSVGPFLHRCGWALGKIARG